MDLAVSADGAALFVLERAALRALTLPSCARETTSANVLLLARALDQFGPCSSELCLRSDLNCDSRVDRRDLRRLLSLWSQT